ncbi:unnamed protein product [Urochloa humidicola]
MLAAAMGRMGRRVALSAGRVAPRRTMCEKPDLNDIWLESTFSRMSARSRKNLQELREESDQMLLDFTSRVASGRDSIIESKRFGSVVQWRVLLVFGSLGYSAFLLIWDAERKPGCSH